MLPLLFVSGNTGRPIDFPPPSAFAYSMRLLSSTYNGNCLKLRRSSDNAELDFGFTLAGLVDTAAIATWLGAANGTVVTWYDQSGNNRNLAAGTDAEEPLYVANVQNGKPVARFDGTDDSLSIVASYISDRFSFLVAGEVTTVASKTVLHLGNSGGDNYNVKLMVITGSGDDGTLQVRMVVTASQELINAAVTGLYNTPHIFAARVKELAAYNLYRDGAQVDSDNGAIAWAAEGGQVGLALGSRISTGEWVGMDVYEVIIYDNELSDAQLTALTTNVNTYWSVY